MFQFSDGSIFEVLDDLILRADQNLCSEAERAVSSRASGEGPDQIWRDGIGDSTSRIPQTFLKVFLPRRYGVMFSDEEVQRINEKTVSLSLKYLGTNTTKNSYILEIE